ncbi:MAG: SRPBCC domain-containing protein [Myxococcales bacterium]|nr:SRPBCC domain-containing protein [Myxococcales bacterium]
MSNVTVEYETEIAAPIQPVWELMTTPASYARWNPFLVRMGGPPILHVGARIELHVRFETGGRARSRELITVFDPPKDGRAELSYRFLGPLAVVGGVRALRRQWLTAVTDQRTLYRTEEVFTGFLTRFLPLAGIRAGFKAHGDALAAQFSTSVDRPGGAR